MTLFYKSVIGICCMMVVVKTDRTEDECRRKQQQDNRLAYTVPVYTDCKKFAQCSVTGLSYISQMCPPGLFFDYDAELGGGACNHAWMVNCEADPCKNTVVQQYSDERDCNNYFVCRHRKSYLARCGNSERYDGPSSRCVPDRTCAPPSTVTTPSGR